MHFPIPALLGLVYGLSEAGLGLLKRSRDDSVDTDRRTLRTLWITIVIAVTGGILVSYRVPQAAITGGPALVWWGCRLFAFGLALRWYSIFYLGRFFTVNVAIHSGHEVVDTGPYRWIRHPSYTGAITAFIGMALTLENWASLALIVLPILWAFVRRIRVEEMALEKALGSPYTKYMARTQRLVPFLY